MDGGMDGWIDGVMDGCGHLCYVWATILGRAE